ncbi:MAG: hypothetical protein KJ052_17725 [Candidatus Hydrogenedentes bacterium]|nr:hypothetical protein [Candidatus Hydrogenedentota bacterium]
MYRVLNASMIAGASLCVLMTVYLLFNNDAATRQETMSVEMDSNETVDTTGAPDSEDNPQQLLQSITARPALWTPVVMPQAAPVQQLNVAELLSEVVMSKREIQKEGLKIRVYLTPNDRRGQYMGVNESFNAKGAAFTIEEIGPDSVRVSTLHGGQKLTHTLPRQAGR